MKEKLLPVSRERVMDLVEQAGIDISDWKNFQGGERKAASNPKYCYEWSYENDKKNIIVLCIWYSNLEYIDNQYIYNFNARKTAEEKTGPGKKRAYNMDFSLQKASRKKIPVRVIICEKGKKESTVGSRLLDSEYWHISSYDDEGNCTLKRGDQPDEYIDQFSLAATQDNASKKKELITQVYERSLRVRINVLTRSSGYCEFCGVKGFATNSGSIYLESHHIIPLSENGEDSVNNVVALCPNHHREAHYGIDNEGMRIKLLEISRKQNEKI